MTDLSAEDIETFTDVMVSKLATAAFVSVDRDHRPINRDEVRMVIIDTELLVSGAVPLERWVENA